MLTLLLLACAGGDSEKGTGVLPDDSPVDSGEDSAPPDTSGDDSEVPVDTQPSTICAEVDALVPTFADVVGTWSAQDALGGWPADPLVFVGSSSIRRWEALAASYADHAPIQRGFGGSQLGEVAYFADELVNVHNPRAVVVYGGANDVKAGVEPAAIVDRLACLRERVPASVPLFYISITPNPSRWSTWDLATEINAGVYALAQDDPSIVYLDTATPFLATGGPPDATLFVADGLHLSESGYALWDSVIRPGVDAVVPLAIPEPVTPLPGGTRILIDLGPSSIPDGEASPSPDHLGQAWNNWFDLEAGHQVLPGEQIVDLVDTAGGATPVDFVVAGGFSCGGRAAGDLLSPDEALLGDLAVGSATGDYFSVMADDLDLPGAFFFRGLDPAARYRLRIYAGHDAEDTRWTTFSAGGTSVSVQTSGPGAGQYGGTVNDDDIVEFLDLAPDAWGGLYVDVVLAEGSAGYLNTLELTVL